MGISIAEKQVYSEVDEFLSLLPDKELNKLPEKLIEFFREEKDKYYKKNIDPNIPIKDQNLKEDTLAIIAFLNLKYWCESEEEKQKLQKMYEENEKKYQEMLKVKSVEVNTSNGNSFNIAGITDNVQEKQEKADANQQLNEENKEVQLTTPEENVFKRLLNKIVGLFKKK